MHVFNNQISLETKLKSLSFCTVKIWKFLSFIFFHAFGEPSPVLQVVKPHRYATT